MLKNFGVGSVELMTNNPLKTTALSDLGIVVQKRIPLAIKANRFSAPYLEVKRKRMRQELPLAAFGVHEANTD
jgi:GTP cyclohydrolase II